MPIRNLILYVFICQAFVPTLCSAGLIEHSCVCKNPVAHSCKHDESCNQDPCQQIRTVVHQGSVRQASDSKLISGKLSGDANPSLLLALEKIFILPQVTVDESTINRLTYFPQTRTYAARGFPLLI